MKIGIDSWKIFGDLVYGLGIANTAIAGVIYFFAQDWLPIFVIGTVLMVIGATTKNLQEKEE